MGEGEHRFTPKHEEKESLFCRCPVCKKAQTLIEGGWVACEGTLSKEHVPYYLGVKNGKLIHRSGFTEFKKEMEL